MYQFFFRRVLVLQYKHKISAKNLIFLQKNDTAHALLS